MSKSIPAVPQVSRRFGKRVALFCEDPSLAVQSQKDESDINVILKNFGVTGSVNVPAVLPTYGNFDLVDDYRSALEAVRAAQEAFGNVPAAIRERFHHDPGAFLEFVSNPSNLPELRSMGLAPTRPEPPPATPAQTG